MSSDKNTPLTSEEIDTAIEVLKDMKDDVANNYMIIELSYTELLFPFDEGLKVVEAMKHAKTYSKSYDRAPKISPLVHHKIRIMTDADVLATHTAELLEIESENEWSKLRDELSKTYPNLRTKSST